MLAADERAQLQRFANQSSPGTPYLRRARIVLLDDEGASQEAIAAELQVPITRVRQMLRAYKREGAAIFPESVWLAEPFEPTDLITDAARRIIADLATTLEQYETDLSVETTVTAIHESRKTTRKMRTALRLFEPYFADRLLRSYRRRARKFMRRLGRSRDNAVFLLKLDTFATAGDEADELTQPQREALANLANYWLDQQEVADRRVRRYLAKGKYRQLLTDLHAFGSGDLGVANQDDNQMIPRVAHIAPVMIYQKLGYVRAMGERLEDLQVDRLHALRIACKELRYTLEFFDGLLGPSAGQSLETVKVVLTHLGDVNDARVHLRMLAQMDGAALATGIDLYRGVIEAQLEQLRQSFPGLWDELDRPEWREGLASAVAVL